MNPTTVGDVRSLVGYLGYYRRHIENFSRIAKPIYDLLAYETDNKSNDNTTKSHQPSSRQVPSNRFISWTKEHQKVLSTVILIDKLVNPPIMAYPNFADPFILHTDASETGLGVVLYQRQKGILRVIGYGSRTFSPAEKNCHLHQGRKLKDILGGGVKGSIFPTDKVQIKFFEGLARFLKQLRFV